LKDALAMRHRFLRVATDCACLVCSMCARVCAWFLVLNARQCLALQNVWMPLIFSMLRMQFVRDLLICVYLYDWALKM